MEKRTAFPPVFWVANLIEVLERFAYYGIYFGFGIYMTSLGYTRAQLGVVQSVFLLLSSVKSKRRQRPCSSKKKSSRP